MTTDLDHLMSHIGEFGRYQFYQFLLHALAGCTAGLHMLTLVTVAAVPDHRCFVPDIDFPELISPWNSTEITSAIPTTNGKMDSCHYINPLTNESTSCDRWVYDNQYYISSRAIEWDMVCSKRWMAAIAQSTYMLGVFTGALVLGNLADKFGRKPIFCISALMQLIFGVGVAFCPDFYSFLVARFIYGIFGSAGALMTGFVLTMEIVGPSKRTVCGVMFQGAFAVGVMLVATWGAVISDRQTLQIVYGLHSIILLPHYWLMDESPRWLWSQGRVKEAISIIQKATKMNGQTPPDTQHFVMRNLKTLTITKDNKLPNNVIEKQVGFMDLVRTPNLRAITLNICFNWFANSLAYYGLSLNTGKLLGNPFLLLFIAGLVEIPSYIATVLVMDRTGRRFLISSLLVAGGLSCLITLFVQQGIMATTIVMIGKFFIAGSFAVVYNYTAELFPTVIRNTAFGVGSMCARTSGALTPLIGLLDSVDTTLPTLVFASVAISSGILSLLLPETLNKPLPQTLEEGERLGDQKSACANWCSRSERRRSRSEVTTTGLNNAVFIED